MSPLRGIVALILSTALGIASCACDCGRPSEDATRRAPTTTDQAESLHPPAPRFDAGTIPMPQPPAEESLWVAVVSDLNGSYGNPTYGAAVHDAIARIIELDPDLVLSAGDMIAGQQVGLSDEELEAMWNGFHAAVSDPLARAQIPFAITPGNHDASGYADYSHEREVFLAEWEPARRPELDFVDASQFPLRYSFRMGPAFFVSLDATTVGPLDNEQMRWLSDQLAQARESVKIVFGHLPLYPFTEGRETEAIVDPSLEALLIERRVSLFLSGHHHAYYPGHRGDLRLVSMACLGSGPRMLLGHDEVSSRAFALIEIRGEKIASVEAYAGADFESQVSRESLPEQVGTSYPILRDDL